MRRYLAAGFLLFGCSSQTADTFPATVAESDPDSGDAGGGELAAGDGDDCAGPDCDVPQSGCESSSDADELCDGVDDDCDGLTDEGFQPVPCGLGACKGLEVCVAGAKECGGADPAPAADEARCDGVDDDCDGVVDEAFVALNCGKGVCATGSRPSSCERGVEVACVPGPPLSSDDALCDGQDDDCDGVVDEDFLPTGCGVGVCAALRRCENGQEVCPAGAPLSSDDASCDGVDDNCNGLTDEDYRPSPCGEGACSALSRCVGGAVHCPGIDPAEDDATCDGVDDDCDGRTDEDFLAQPCGVGVCRTNTVCVAGEIRCPAVAHGATDDDCDGQDDDCDGIADDDFVGARCGDPACGAVVVCQAGVTACPEGEPEGDDDDCDGVDDDCDGQVDEQFAPQACGVGACRTTTVCFGGRILCPEVDRAPADTSCDGVDDDCDGETDEDYRGVDCGVGACAATTACEGGEPRCPAGVPDPDDLTCDGVDDDCDGTSDEDFVIGVCGVGACVAETACLEGQARCPAVEHPDQDRTCDGVDDDCDGVLDDDYERADCSVGECVASMRCQAAEDGVGPTEVCEMPAHPDRDVVCDGLDQDCDGAVDEDWRPGACGRPGVCAGVSECSDGEERCVGEGDVAGDDSDCDGLDDDCDGDADESFDGVCDAEPLPPACQVPPIDDGLDGGERPDMQEVMDAGGEGAYQEERLEQAFEDLVVEFGDPPEESNNAPVVEVFPRSGGHLGPIALRMCVEDADGLADLDMGTLVFEFEGVNVVSEFVWTRVGRTKVCGRISAEEPSRFVLVGEREPDQWPVTVTGRIRDRAGRLGEATATYELSTIETTRWSDVGRAAGIQDNGYGGHSHDLGVAWIDFDRDHYPDLYLTNGTGGQARLYRNNGDGTFQDVTGPLALERFETPGAVFADVDNDGDEDLYVLGDHPIMAQFDVAEAEASPGHRNHLFLNYGGHCFREATEEAGLRDVAPDGRHYQSSAASFADYDLDGCIDLYVVHWHMGGSRPSLEQDKLYRGDCRGGFEDVTVEAGLGGYARDGLAVLFADLNGDRYPDLYVVNDTDELRGRPERRDDDGLNWGPERGDDLLFVNNGDGTFSDITAESGVGPHALAGMGIDLGDYDGDGDFDLYITDLDEAVAYSSPLYRNLLVETGEFRFEQIAFEVGTRPLTGGGGGTMWGVLFADFNLDTHLDLMVTGGRARYLFVGRGDGDFVTAAGPDSEVHSDGTGLPLFVTSTIGSAMADFDRDGDPDVLLVRCDQMQQGATPLLLRNDTPRGLKHFLEIDLVGTQSNRSAIGTVVEVRPEGLQGPVLLRQVVAGHSAHSQSERVLHFGLGQHERVDRIDVRWPSGLDQVLRDVAVDRMLIITEGVGATSWSPPDGWVPSVAPARP